MVQDLGLRGNHHAQRGLVALEVGRQNLDPASRGLQPNLADDLHESLSGAEIVIVAVDAGNDGVCEPELGHGVGDAAWLVKIDRLRPAFGDGAKSAAPRAQIAQHHEGSGLLVPALADVGALGALAHGVQVQVAGQLLERVKGLAAGSLGLQPLGLAYGQAGAEIDLHKLGDLGRGRHGIYCTHNARVC